MRYCLLFITVVCALPVYAVNESVAAISYNPSRLGAYSHLKVAKKAQLSGMDATNADVNITSVGTVEMTNSRSQCNSNADISQGNCDKVTTVLSMASRTGCSAYSDFCSNADKSASLSTGSNTVVQRKTVEGSVNYLATSDLPDIATEVSIPSSMGTTVNVTGGTLNATGSSSKVFVNQITGTLANIKIDALSSGTIILNEKNAANQNNKIEVTDEFKLGNITIVPPGNAPASGLFRWKERSDEYGSYGKVLTFR